jgi:putative peptidoglycan lipid II flippase
MSATALMTAGTLVSRILGTVRVAVLGWALGAGIQADPFAVANTLPNSLYVLIGGGVLNAVLVPQIVRAAQHSDGGQEYVDRLVTLAVMVLGGATLVTTALAPLLVRLYTQDWPAASVSLATGFALWCLPQIFFYGLYTIYGQVLNARNSFGPYLWAPVVNNVVAIAGTLVFIAIYGGGGKDVTWWGFGPVALFAGTATLGVVAQALVLLPVLRRVGYHWHPRWGWRGVGLRRAGRVAGWTFAGVLVGQLGFVVISKVAGYGGLLAARDPHPVPRGRQVYDWAYQLFFLPHSLVAVSLVTAVFTRMAAAAAAGRTDQVRADVSLAVRLTGVATVISTVAFVVLGRDLARIAFLGNTRLETDSIALVTGAMVLGLVPFSALYLFQRAWYAHEDARTPFWLQVIATVLWTGGSLLSALLPGPWVVPGVGLSMSLANLVTALVGAWWLRRRIAGLDGARILRTHVRLAVAAVVAGLAGWAVVTGTHAVAGVGRGGALASLLVAGVAMLGVYAAALRAMRVEELGVLLGPVLGRLRRSRPIRRA